ncbi:branched-chain amino acid ABC transporter permease [Naumannella sp. ID2617S]|uniref:Branched-chain amino acid ABC transporter permease n=1 Tax=Enemella dayhoffiae TaxID=2016507 RepID=A0A255HCA0_9ACTN|nr:branched-chain amino acid ABC transporter permease [Enemella dayhoffiae]NNG18114.1 branched-chain amino acid ABC transporter permease [Naumannella sp. ID2617S]OYO23904.1 hypothetical protein CGZ93_05135 [Enemella dayhoffiae]
MATATTAPDTQRRRRPVWLGPVLLLVGLIVLISVPFWLAPYPVQVLSKILCFALVVVSVDLLTGYTGLPTLGQVAYFGAGAYTAGLVGIHLTTNVFIQLIAGTLVAAVMALVTGAVAVRTTGFVFLMVTLAITELAHKQADAAKDLTGGSNGLSGIPAFTFLPGGDPIRLPGLVYFWVLVVFLIGIGLSVLLVRSPMGRSMRGVRDGEGRMRAIGRRTYVVKLVAFTFAGSLAGMAGTAWTAQTRFVSPGDMAFSLSAIALLAAILGGQGTIWGPIIGAAIVMFVRDYIGPMADGRTYLILGLLFVIAVFALPRGIAGLVRRRTPAPKVAGEGDPT